MLLLIDNYDSFTYNLYQYLAELGADVKTVRNDKINLEEIEDLDPEGIIISPGPSTPLEAGISNDVIRHFGPKLPTLGVCLGHQCVGVGEGQYLVDELGGQWPSEVFIGPVVCDGRPIAILYADNLPSDQKIGPTEGLETFIKVAEIAFSKALLERKAKG